MLYAIWVVGVLFAIWLARNAPSIKKKKVNLRNK